MVEHITLNDGSSIPQLGLGVWQVGSRPSRRRSWAGRSRPAIGSIDTAEGYNNEEGVGEAIRTSDVPRDELFITSKLRNGAHQRDAALREFDETMNKLGLDQLDLFLIHWPVPARTNMSRRGRRLWNSGMPAASSRSAFPTSTRTISSASSARPASTPVVNQIELHPHFQQRDKRDFHASHDIAIESWSPLGSGRLLDDPTLAGIAGSTARRSHRRSSAGICSKD